MLARAPRLLINTFSWISSSAYPYIFIAVLLFFLSDLGYQSTANIRISCYVFLQSVLHHKPEDVFGFGRHSKIDNISVFFYIKIEKYSTKPHPKWMDEPKPIAFLMLTSYYNPSNIRDPHVCALKNRRPIYRMIKIASCFNITFHTGRLTTWIGIFGRRPTSTEFLQKFLENLPGL